MMGVLANKYVQAVLVFVVIVGGYVLYQNMMYQRSMTDNTPMDMSDSGDISGMPTDESEGGMDYTGTHIMPNGDVMTGAGVVLPDAVINGDGTVIMPDGTIIEPAMDMRQ